MASSTRFGAASLVMRLARPTALSPFAVTVKAAQKSGMPSKLLSVLSSGLDRK